MSDLWILGCVCGIAAGVTALEVLPGSMMQSPRLSQLPAASPAQFSSQGPAQPTISSLQQPAPLPVPAPAPLDISGEVFYHIMPIAWRYGGGAQSSADATSPQDQYRFGNFQGITQSLPYLKSLGVTAIWLNPIFPSPAYHGYQHGPADQINPWFGTEAEFKSLLDACRGEGIKVFLDLVVYGINQDSVYFKGAKGNPASGYGPMLAFTDSGNSKFIGYDFKTWTGDTVGFINWDLRRTSAKRLVFEWSKKWVDPRMGVAGYRLDHVWQKYDKGPDGLGYHIDSFWKEWREEIESVHPRVFTFAEQANWVSFGAELLRTSSGKRVHDATFTKPFEFAAREALRDEHAEKLYLSTAATLTACPDGYTFMGIIGDHDVDRLASAIGDDVKPGRVHAAAAVLMLQPFPPVMYYGDEIGMLGKEGTFNSDANDIPRREPMRWEKDSSTSKVMTNYYAIHKGAYDNRYTKDGDGRSVQEQSDNPTSLLNKYRELAKVRAKYSSLRTGQYIAVPTDSPATWCFVKRAKRSTVDDRALAPGLSVLVAINLSGTAVKVNTTLTDPIQKDLVGLRLPASIDLDAYGYRVIEVSEGR